MPDFTKWLADCCEFLERGHAVVDVLRYLGDDVAPRPDELEYFPDGYKCDFLNQDVLYNRLEVRGGRFVLPDGMSYSRLWVPEGAFLLPKTRDRLSALSNKGGTVVYGRADEATKGIVPQLVVKEGATGEVLWYHRQDNGTDCYFLAAATNGFQGRVVLRTQEGMCDVELALAPSETRFATIEKGGIVRGLPDTCGWSMASVVNGFELAFPDGWGAPVEPIVLDDLVPWKDMIGLSEEGRVFSGTATYTTTLHISEGLPGTCLDLGRVRDCARVFINGSHVADLWAEPYRCDIGKYVHVGDNTLRVEVTSSWFNRLAYDLQRPASKRKTWTVWKAVRAEAPRESGLIGPVRLFCRRTPQYRETTR